MADAAKPDPGVVVLATHETARSGWEIARRQQCAWTAVGIAGQIAKKIRGAQKVIGIAGGKKKCDYIVNELGFDAAIDYKEFNTKDKMINKLKNDFRFKLNLQSLY